MRVKMMVAALCCGVMLTPMAQAGHKKKYQPQPHVCTPTVAPVRNKALLAQVSLYYNYPGQNKHLDDDTKKMTHDFVMGYLNADGMDDGNTFKEPDGVPAHLYLTYTVTVDDQRRSTGSLRMEGWGQGYITTFNRTQYPYDSPMTLLEDLTKDMYVYIHEGWHDSAPGCSAAGQ